MHKRRELAQLHSGAQLLAFQDRRWSGTCAFLALALHEQEVKARATPASHQRVWTCARTMRVSQRNPEE